PQWTFGLALSYRPIQAVLMPRRTDQTRRVHATASGLLSAVKVIALRIDTSEQGADRRELVAANAAIDNRLCSRLGVEGPIPVRFDDRDRQWPIVWADVELHLSGRNLIDRVLFIVESDKAIMKFLISVAVT